MQVKQTESAATGVFLGTWKSIQRLCFYYLHVLQQTTRLYPSILQSIFTYDVATLLHKRQIAFVCSASGRAQVSHSTIHEDWLSSVIDLFRLRETIFMNMQIRCDVILDTLMAAVNVLWQWKMNQFQSWRANKRCRL